MTTFKSYLIVSNNLYVGFIETSVYQVLNSVKNKA